MAGNYSGVPSAGVTYGTAIQTGSGGTSNVDDYSVPVYGLNADGKFYRLPAGMTIPAGQTISLATPPQSSATGGSAVTGTGIVDQAETQRHNVAMETNATNQTANQAAGNQNQFNASMATIASNDRASQLRHEEAMQQFAATMAQNAANYQIEVSRFGLEQATFNYNQAKDAAANKLLAAQFGMSVANFNLSRDSFNASQRQALADAKLKIDTLLASKKGPDDWVAYNNLLNGMSRPTPTGERVIDPYAGLADLYQPSTAQAPTMPDLSIAATPSNVTPPPFPSGNLLSGSTGSSSGAGGTSPSYPAYVPPATVKPFTDGAASGAGTGLTVTAAPAGASGFSPAGWTAESGFQPAHWSGNVDGTMGASTPEAAPKTAPLPTAPSYGPGGNLLGTTVNHTGQNIPGMAQGGSSSGPVLVGDSKSGKPTGHEEIVYARTGPHGENLIDVLPHSAIAPILDAHHGHSNGTVIGAHKLDQNLLHGLHRAAEGGEFGVNTEAGQGGDTLQPIHGESAFTQRPGLGGLSGLGGPSGIMSPGGPTSVAAGPGHGWAGPSTAPAAQPATTNGTSLGAGWTPTIANGGMAYSATQPATGGATSTTSSTAQPATQGTGLSSSNIAAQNPGTAPLTSNQGASNQNLLAGPNPAVAPSTSTGYVPDAPGSYGTANTQPYNVYRTYSSQDLGNQPFIQKILGQRPGSEFGNFGAQLSNPSLGISNMPFNISLQRFNLLRPSEQEQLKSLYEQGLATPFDDVLAAAKASAPVGRGRSTLGQGVQSNRYGG